MEPSNLNPLRDLLLDEGASLMPYGVAPPEPGTVQREAAGEELPLLAAAFGPIELEYASLRTDCVVMDRPDRAVVEVTGADAREFLGRMLTQDVARLEVGQSCNSFWLNRKGRIDADLRVMRLLEAVDAPPRFYLDLERGSLDLTLKTLGAYIITEDVRLAPRHDIHRLSLHGPRARDLLLNGDETATIFRLVDGGNAYTEVPDGVTIKVDALTSAGVPGFELYVPRREAVEVYRCLIATGRPPAAAPSASFASSGDRGARIEEERRVEAEARARAAASPDLFVPLPPESIRLRPCGWFAYNIARIEAGTPLFKIDFGSENLPAETGVIDDRVSFKKGCYLGQEIVARMHARGHPKQRLVGLRFDDDLPEGPDGLPPLPVQGERVFAADDTSAEPKPIGSITSSTFSPMLGRVPIALAMVGWSHTPAGTRVVVETEGRRIGGVVQGSLRFLP